MGLTESLIFYLLIGAAITVAIFVTDNDRAPTRTWFLLSTTVLFWPIYLPLLLSERGEDDAADEPTNKARPDEMAAAIAQVQRELDAALSSLDGWAERAMSCESDRIAELCHALTAQAARIREMDDVLSRTDVTRIDADPKPEPNGSATPEALVRWQKSQHARNHNLTRLADVRRQSHADLMATLAWIRELVSMIHLAKFTGAPASRAEELVAQIAAAVEGVSAVAWQEPDAAPPPATTTAAAPTGAAVPLPVDDVATCHQY